MSDKCCKAKVIGKAAIGDSFIIGCSTTPEPACKFKGSRRNGGIGKVHLLRDKFRKAATRG